MIRNAPTGSHSSTPGSRLAALSRQRALFVFLEWVRLWLTPPSSFCSLLPVCFSCYHDFSTLWKQAQIILSNRQVITTENVKNIFSLQLMGRESVLLSSDPTQKYLSMTLRLWLSPPNCRDYRHVPKHSRLLATEQ